MKAQKMIQRGCLAGGVAGATVLVSGLVVTRLLPPWVPLSWRPHRLPKADQPFA